MGNRVCLQLSKLATHNSSSWPICHIPNFAPFFFLNFFGNYFHLVFFRGYLLEMLQPFPLLKCVQIKLGKSSLAQDTSHIFAQAHDS